VHAGTLTCGSFVDQHPKNDFKCVPKSKARRPPPEPKRTSPHKPPRHNRINCSLPIRRPFGPPTNRSIGQPHPHSIPKKNSLRSFKVKCGPVQTSSFNRFEGMRVCLVVAWAGIASGIVRRDDVADNMLVAYCLLICAPGTNGQTTATSVEHATAGESVAEVVTHTS
jgi:hypothetical protein